MAHFYLELTGGSETVEDEAGIELPDLAAAHVSAVTAARDIMAADIRTGVLDLRLQITILDHARHRVGIVEFDEAVSLLTP